MRMREINWELVIAIVTLLAILILIVVVIITYTPSSSSDSSVVNNCIANPSNPVYYLIRQKERKCL